MTTEQAPGLRDASVTLTGTLTDSGAEWAGAVEAEAAARIGQHGVALVDKVGIECLCGWTCGFDSGVGGWIAFNRHLHSAPLDIERLARAYHRTHHGGSIDTCLRADEDRHCARRIAAEYARLRD